MSTGPVPASEEGCSWTAGQNDGNLNALVAQLQAKEATLKGLVKGEASDKHAKVTILCASLAPQNPHTSLILEDPKD